MSDLQEQGSAQALSDEELVGVTAGAASAGDHTTEKVMTNWYTQCGYEDNWTRKLSYYPCPRCGKPMHSEIYAAKWYCDPCNYSKFLPSSASWSGTKDELIAAAK